MSLFNKMPLPNKVFLFVMPLLTGAISLFGQVRFNPGLGWQTIHTPHCSVYFSRGNDSLAVLTAQKAERFYSRLAEIFRTKTTERLHIVLDTQSDILLDASTPFPNKTVFLNPTTLNMGLGHYGDWFDLVLAHEITHAVDVDKVGGLAGVVRAILGRIYFPGGFGAQWQTEGIATHFETELTGGGRAVDPYYDMILRMAFLENRVTTPDQNTYFLTRWPQGTSAYVFGMSFYEYMAGRFGRESVINMRERYASNFIPFRTGEAVQAGTGLGMKQFYREWKRDLNRRYQQQADSLRRRGLTVTRPVTRSGYQHWSPQWSRDGRKIYFSFNDPDRHGQIRVADLSSGRIEHVRDVNQFETRISVHSSEKGETIYLTRLEFRSLYALQTDLAVVDARSGRLKMLSSGGHFRDPAVSPDGNELIYIRSFSGKSELWRLDMDSGEEIRLLGAADGRQFYQPTWSPDGKKMAVSVWLSGGERNIWILDLTSGRFLPLLQGKAWDFSPCWSPDGRYLLFSSDRTGVFNLFAYDFEEHRLLQLTNVMGGAFEPAVSPDGRQIAFVNYSSQGFEIHLMDWNPARFVHSQKSIFLTDEEQSPLFVYGNRPTEPVENKLSDPAAWPVNGYSPLPTLRPRFFLPFLSADEAGSGLGAFTFGQDVLGVHSYALMAQAGLESGRPGFQAIYNNKQFYPEITLEASDLTFRQSLQVVDSDGETRHYWDRRRQLTVGISIPFPGIDISHGFNFSVHRRLYQSVFSLYPGERNPYFTGDLNSFQASYHYSSARRYPRSISAVEGITASLDYENFPAALGSDVEFFRLISGLQKFFRFPGDGRQVLYFRGLYGRTNLPSGIRVASPPEASIRGHSEFNWRGDLFLGSTEIRFPLIEVERSTPWLPVFVQRLHGRLFADAARFDPVQTTREDIWSAGAELQLDLVFGYLLPGTLHLGLAYPGEKDENLAFYFNLVLN